MSDVKRRAQQLLGELLDDAAGVLKLSLKRELRLARLQPNPTVDARFVFAAALELDDVRESGQPTAGEQAVGKLGLKELAEMSERLRLVRQEERKQSA